MGNKKLPFKSIKIDKYNKCLSQYFVIQDFDIFRRWHCCPDAMSKYLFQYFFSRNIFTLFKAKDSIINARSCIHTHTHKYTYTTL